MHDTNRHHHHGHDHHHEHDRQPDDLERVLAMLEHWIEHGDSHLDSYREWAAKAREAGQDEVAKEIGLAIADSETARNHLKRAKAVLAASLVYRDRK